MKNVRPCPYCGGEVEVVKLIRRDNEKKQPYRIQCMRCKALVARGTKFEKETQAEADQRIEDYNNEIKKLWNPMSSTVIKQTDAAKSRDWIAANSAILGPDDEVHELHDPD